MDIRSHVTFLGSAQTKNLRIENLVTDPTDPSPGQVWLNTTDNLFKGFNGTDIIQFGTAADFQLFVAVLNAVLAAVGLNSDGIPVLTNSTYLHNATSVNNALSLLDSVLAGTRTRFAESYFLYTSAQAQQIHSIVHELGWKYCSVTIVDSNDYVILPDSIHFDSADQLTVSFDMAINCKVLVLGKHS